MEAVIVAGGLGTRLLPLTEHRPKHLLPVAGIPLVAHQLAKLAAVGISRVVLATSYHADQFEPVLGDGREWGLDLVYLREDRPLGTAGAIRNAAGALSGHVDEPVVVLNGDILSSHDLDAQLRRHIEQVADVTLHLVEVADPRAYGCVPTQADGRVVAFLEKSPDPVSRQVNAGCYVLSRMTIDSIPPGRVVSVERETFPGLLLAGRRLVGHLDQAYWRDLGTPAALCEASSDLVRGIATSPAAARPPGEAWVSSQASVDPSAKVRGGSAVGAGARVGSGAVLDGSLVDEGATVGARSQVVDSVVGRGAAIGPDVILRDSVVGDNAEVGPGCELVGGARVWCDVTIPAGGVRFSSGG